jgi:hypothetical protein
MKWPGRATVRGLTYEPGAGAIVSGHLNTWKGLAIEAEQGDVEPFTMLVDFLFSNGTNAEAKAWFWKWLAFPIQHPGAKLPNCPLFHGEQGTGKTMVGLVMKNLYGDNGVVIEDKDLTGDFNEWAQYKQFCLGDEISAKSLKDADRMKALISRLSVRINDKFVQAFQIRDCINYILTSNKANSIHMDRGDRRYMVCHVPGAPMSKAKYATINDWMWEDPITKQKPNRKSLSALLYHLLYEIELSDFNPDAPPPVTSAKEDAIAASQDDASDWANRLKSPDPEDAVIGSYASMKLATPRMLEALFYKTRPDGQKVALGTARDLRRALVEARFKQANDGEQIHMGSGWGNQRVWILDQTKNSRWAGSDLAEKVLNEVRKQFVADYGQKIEVK